MHPVKNPRSKARTNNKLNPHMMVGPGFEIWAILVGGESSHHCAIPAPLVVFSFITTPKLKKIRSLALLYCHGGGNGDR